MRRPGAWVALADEHWRAARWPVVSRPGDTLIGAVAAICGFCVCLVLCLALLLRVQIASGFNLLSGGGSVEVAILEHWYNVARLMEPWSAPAFFYPLPNGLGYGNGYFLYGLIYSVCRALGGDPFLSAELVHAWLHAAGFAGCFALLRAGLGIGTAWSLFGASLFALSHNLAAQAHPGPLLSVSFAPVAGLLLLLGLRQLLAGAQRRLLACGLLFAGLMSGWLLTAYAMAWCFALYVLCCAALALLLAPGGSRTALLGACWGARGTLTLIALAQLLGLAPFLWVYGPLAAATGGHDLAQVLALGPRPLDVIRTGADNLVWGRLDVLLAQHAGPAAHPTGLPLLLVWLFLAACGWLVFAAADARDRLVRLLALAGVAAWLLAVQCGDFTLWREVVHAIPGARGLRAVADLQIALVLPVVAAVALLLQHLASRTPRVLLLPLCAMLVAEEVSLGAPAMTDRPAAMAALARIPAPPAACQAFYLLAGSPAEAMLVAEWRHIPTLDGVSSFSPPDWAAGAPAVYAGRMAHIVQTRALSGVCTLDYSTGAWRVATVG